MNTYQNKSTGKIYVAINLKNGKKYVGKTIIPVSRRIKQHIQAGRITEGYYFRRSLKKYGLSNFVILESNPIPREKLNHAEKLAIKFCNSFVPNGYNLTEGGDGGGRKTGEFHHTKKTKKLLQSLAEKQGFGKIKTKEHIRNQNLSKSKLKPEDLLIIENLLKEGKTLQTIADKFKVTKQLIWFFKKGKLTLWNEILKEIKTKEDR